MRKGKLRKENPAAFHTEGGRSLKNKRKNGSSADTLVGKKEFGCLRCSGLKILLPEMEEERT